MLKPIAAFLSMTLLSCSSSQMIRDSEIDIVIVNDLSYRYDLKAQTYSIFNIESDTTIHFKLSSKEKEQIINKYYDLQLNEIKGRQFIEDNCMVMPKLFTTLKITSSSQYQELVIDENCKNYKGLFDTKAVRIATFLRFVRNMLVTKPEIKAAPPSDILYL